MELFKLFGTIAIQNADANEAIDDTTDKAQQSENKISSAFKKIGTVVAGAMAADKIKDFGLNCINAASDANAASSQFSQVSVIWKVRQAVVCQKLRITPGSWKNE